MSTASRPSNPDLADKLALLTPSSETFTADEEAILQSFFTNTTRSVVALRNLPEATKGALFSRYSRTPKGVRRLFLDEFRGQTDSIPISAPDQETLHRAEAFYGRVLSDYGDDSVGELGGAHIAYQEISQVAAKAIEDCRIGASYLEKSTRYVRFDDKVDGRYRYYRDRKALASPFGPQFVAVLDHLFDAYSQSFPLMVAHLQQQFPIEDIVFDNVLTGEAVRFAAIRDQEFRKSAQTAYNQALRARACDALRCFLPLASLTNVGVYANGRAHEYMLTKLYADPLDEVQTLALAANHELEQVIGPFIKRANTERGQAHQRYLQQRRAVQQHWAQRVVPAKRPVWSPGESRPPKVTLLDYDPNALDKVVAAVLFPFVELPETEIREQVAALPAAEKEQILAAYLGERTNRRHKPGRAFERAVYTFELVLNIGEYRDLQRHRICTPLRQQFTTVHGYDTNADVAAVTQVRGWYEQAMERAHALFASMSQELPDQAQYLVPMGYRVRYSMQMNLREAYYLIELRSSEQGHRDYRQTAQEMYQAIKAVHPVLAQGMTWANLTPDVPMGRLRAEMRSALRRSQASAAQL